METTQHRSAATARGCWRKLPWSEIRNSSLQPQATGRKGEERTDESPVEGEAGGGGRGGVIEDGIHSRFPVHRLAGSALR